MRFDFTKSMREDLAPTQDPDTWTEFPAWDRTPPDARPRESSSAIAQITSIAGDTRSLTVVAGTLLAADLIAATAMMAALLGHRDAFPPSSVGLLALVTLSWLRASLQTVLAEQPVACALGELRRATGAPVDLSAPWPPLGVRRVSASDLGWEQAVPLIGAATIRHARARTALSWAVITTIGLCIWTGVSIAVSALS